MSAPPGTQTLETLKPSHDRAIAAGDAATAGSARSRARRRAWLEGVAVPEWAHKMPRGRTASPWSKRAPMPPSSAPAISTAIPDTLVRWRSADGGRCVAIGRDAVTLTAWVAGKRHDARYSTIAMAVAAVESGAVALQPWRAPTVTPRFGAVA